MVDRRKGKGAYLFYALHVAAGSFEIQNEELWMLRMAVDRRPAWSFAVEAFPGMQGFVPHTAHFILVFPTCRV